MAYKEKTCPKCGTVHTKRGQFCSRSCGNTRAHREETKIAIASTQAIRHSSGDDIAEAQRHALMVANGSMDPVAPPKVKQISQNQFVQDGDLWTEV